MEKTAQTEQKLEASFSLLIMSMAQNAMMAMGLTPDPQTGKSEIDKNLAQFNIDLLLILKEKTKSNLTGDEEGLLGYVLQDLQMKFIQVK